MAAHGVPVRRVDGTTRGPFGIGQGREDLLYDERRTTAAGLSGVSAEMFGANGFANDIGDLDALLAKLGSAARIVRGEPYVQEGHAGSVKTRCLYVKALR